MTLSSSRHDKLTLGPLGDNSSSLRGGEADEAISEIAAAKGASQ
jgi:hypothetical protein